MGSCGKACFRRIMRGISFRCEECYDEVTGEFRVAVEVEEEIEML